MANVPKAVGGALGVIGAAATLVPMAIQVVDKFREAQKEKNENLVDIPPIVSSKGHVKLEAAKRYIEKVGLKVGECEANPKPKYRDYSEFDVVSISPNKKKVQVGSLIVIHYITKDIIERSKKLFDEAEVKKSEALHKKIEKKVRKTKDNQSKIEIIDVASDTVIDT